MSADATPIPAHIGPEFLLWLWWRSERDEARFDLEKPVGRISLWVDERLAFRRPSDLKVTAVLTGENPSTTPEARAALAGGKVVQELRIGMKRDDREYTATLRGSGVDISGLKVPQVMSEKEDDAIADRMFLYEEFVLVLSALMQAFAEERTSRDWSKQTLPTMRAWLAAELPSSEG